MLDAALDYSALILARAPHVREEGVVLLVRVERELRLLAAAAPRGVGVGLGVGA